MTQRIALVVAVVAIGVGVLAAGAFAHSQQATANTITVTLKDFKIVFTKKPAVIKHGVKYTVTEINKGAAAHNVDFQGVKAGPIIAPGKSKTFAVTFKKAGKVPYVCDVPRHAELGMAGTLTVK